MKPIKRALKALIVTLLAYLAQVCVMRYLTVRGVTGSVIFAALSVIIVSCGKKYAFCASCLIGMMMETMVGNVPALYVIAYPVITMFVAQSFSDLSDRQLQQRRMRIESRQVRISEGRGKEHWWYRLADSLTEGNLPPVVRIPLCAAAMDLLMNITLCAYLYLIGEEIILNHFVRIFISVLYTTALALILMVPLRWALGMYKKRKRSQEEEEIL